MISYAHGKKSNIVLQFVKQQFIIRPKPLEICMKFNKKLPLHALLSKISESESFWGYTNFELQLVKKGIFGL